MSEVIIERSVIYRVIRPMNKPLDAISWGKIIHATSAAELSAEIAIGAEDRNINIIHTESRVFQEVSEADVTDED
jgi:hypothetical protein